MENTEGDAALLSFLVQGYRELSPLVQGYNRRPA
jgi:hypothetical protein